MIDSRFFQEKGPFKVADICKIADCRIKENNPDFATKQIKGVAPLNTATADDLTFLDNPKYIESFQETKAGACIVADKFADYAPEGLISLISENPYMSFALATNAFYPSLAFTPEISKRSYIHKSAKIGKDCRIEDGVVIAENVAIGDNCHIGANSVISRGVVIGNNCYIGNLVSIAYSIIENNVVIHNGAKIGQDGFGFASDRQGNHAKVPQVGRVIIQEDVEIGANTCIDRGSSPDTIIGAGTKIDNLVQIGHNVQIGRNCIIVSQVGVSGSTKIGDSVVLGGQVGLAGHLKIGSGVKVAAQSGVMHDIPAGKNFGGSPAVPIKQWHRQNVTLKNMSKKEEGVK